jgi:uracil-DNA glycosylase family 4
MSTETKLLKLVNKIKNCMKCCSPYESYTTERSAFVRDLYLEGPWFFPPRGSVKGFLGTAKLMFVAEKPATDKPFTRPQDKYLYCLLQKYGLGEAHVTDLVKCRGKVRVETKEERCLREKEYINCRDFLKKEIKLINPKLIVAFGNKSYVELKELNLGIELKEVQHYSYRKLSKQKLENDFKQIARLYKQLSIRH